ncbi:hypothetical protein ADEAN_000212200 [Angomonas deanei]|uniref:Uncharacterized protein n=1 Tax=Angomonas deanei TaxID=59799 RepID=A0A7G2C6I7_9TRYP|nr:hypothetical protein ADEAN_000212200 [Angomonas deanei]
MIHGEVSYTEKCAELDNLLRRHYVHKETKQRSLERKLEEERQRSALLQALVEDLRAQLECLLRDRKQQLSLEEWRRSTTLELDRKLSLVDEKVTELKGSIFAQKENEAALLSIQENINKARQSFSAEVETTRSQLTDDINRAKNAERIRRDEHQKMLEDTEKERQRMLRLLSVENQMLNLILLESAARAAVADAERDDSVRLYQYHNQRLHRWCTDMARNNNALQAQSKECILREKKAHIQLNEEKNRLLDCTRILLEKREEFSAEVESILYDVQALLTSDGRRLPTRDFSSLQAAKEALCRFVSTLPEPSR